MVDEKFESEELKQDELKKASGAGIPSAQRADGREAAPKESYERDSTSGDPDPDPHKVLPT